MKRIITLMTIILSGLYGHAQFFGCNAYFSYWPNGNQVYFYTQDGNSMSLFEWNFGDGSTGLGQYPNYTYAVGGVYTVCLTVSNVELACTETFCMDVEICDNNAVIESSQVDNDTWFFENTGYQGMDQTWNIYPGYAQYLGNSFTHDFIMSGTYSVDFMMNTGETYIQNYVDGEGNIYSYEQTCSDSSVYEVEIDLENGANVSGSVFLDSDSDGLFDSEEIVMNNWTTIVILGAGQELMVYAENGNWSAELAPGTYSIFSTYSLISGFGITLPTTEFEYIGNMVQGYTITVAENDVVPNVNFGITTQEIVITGKVFGDENGNGVMDGNDQGLSYYPVIIDEVMYAVTNAEGDYFVVMSAEDHTVTTIFSGSYSLPVGGQYEIVDPNDGDGFVFDFGLNISTNDLACDISYVSPHVPGFTASFSVYSHNNGLAQENITTVVQLDDDVEYMTSWSWFAVGTYDEGTHTVTWNHDLATLEVGYMWITVSIPETVELGDDIVYTATISSAVTDDLPANNTSTHESLVVASYDPNMIEVNPVGSGEEGFIEANQELQYTIHFQNTGSYYATNVILKDALPSQLDPQTIIVTGSSHDVITTIDGNDLQFTFSNIMLTWSDMNEEDSKGWISFRIQQDMNLPIGTEISNTAEIYFDFNEPIITNTVLNTIGEEISVPEIPSDIQISAMPNPGDEYVEITWTTETGNVRVEVINMLGEIISKQNSNTQRVRIDRDGIEAGFYTVRILSENSVIGQTGVVFR